MSVPIRPGPRLMLYCHDTYGLGHLRRTLTLARYLAARTPALSQLIVTGSPVPHNFAFPDRTDYVKLPSVLKVGATQYVSRSLNAPFTAICDMRGEMILSAATHFRPDVLIVDHAPAGLRGEILATLRAQRDQSLRHTRLVLGLRDILDEASRVRKAWSHERVYELLDDHYDLILVYGQPDVYNVVKEYGFSPRAAAKTRYVGYLWREPGAQPPAEVRRRLELCTGRLVVVTVGGGGDGSQLVRAAVDALQLGGARPRFDCLLIGGPLMDPPERHRLIDVVRTLPAARFLDFTEDMASYIGAADVVVSMGGYNSVCEILSAGRPAIIVPRVAPRKEQLLRAEALQRRGLIQTIHPAELSGARFLEAVTSMLEHPPVGGSPVAMGGLAGVATELDAILAPCRRGPPRLVWPRTDSGLARPRHSRRLTTASQSQRTRMVEP